MTFETKYCSYCKVRHPIDDFQKGRMLGALETILILNGKLQGGKTYAQDDENFTTKMIRLTKSFLEEPTVEPPTDDDDKLE